MRFSTVVADPPWDYNERFGSGNSGFSHAGADGHIGAAEQYQNTMRVDEIVGLGSDGVIAGFQTSPSSHLYLWVTNAFVEQGHLVARAWGYRPITMLTWHKDRSTTSRYYFKGVTEHVIFAVRGSLLPLQVRDATTIFSGHVGRHSSKPYEFYRLIERCSPGPYVELFARVERPNWTTWGNQIERDLFSEHRKEWR